MVARVSWFRTPMSLRSRRPSSGSARDPSLVASMGASGREFAETLNWDRAACETEAHLQGIVGSPMPVGSPTLV